MPGENIQDWSVTAANNGTADSAINWAEGQARNTVNNSARSMMAAHAKQRNLQNGSIVTSGTANAQAFFSGLNYTAPIPTGLRVLLKIGPTLTNTAAATLEMDGLGPVAIKSIYGTPLTGGEMLAGSYAEFLYDGTNWLLLRASLRVNVQKFIASGTYTPTPGMVYCSIEVIGGGGGGGGCLGAGAMRYGGGGGGAGGYSRKLASASDIGASQVVTIGALGAGGINGIGNGGNGGNTSVGSLCLAYGGNGGLNYYGPGGVFGYPGGGAAVGVGDLAVPGSAGEFGKVDAAAAVYFMYYPAGRGASSIFGGGGAAQILNSGDAVNGLAATGYGAGGAGAEAHSNGFNLQGGNGSPGFVLITEFRT
jgi:hypothetical protein